MTVGGLKVKGRVAALASLVVLAGCGDPNAGDAYAAELRAFLDTQSAVVAHEVGGRNDLPFSGSASTSITLDPALDAQGVVESVMPIVTHRTKRKASTNDTTIVFGAPGGTNDDATTSFYLNLAKPLPDTDRTRNRLTSLVTQAGDYVKADPGIVAVTAQYKVVTIETTSDPFVIAPLVDKVLRSGEQDSETRAGKPRQPDLEVTRDKERMTVASGDDLDWLGAARPALAVARRSPELVSIWAYASGEPRTPRLTIRLRSEASDAAVGELRQRVAPPGVTVEVLRAAPSATESHPEASP